MSDVTQAQEIGRIVATAVVATLSIACSSCIVLHTRNQLNKPYHRLLLVLSLVDIVSSTKYAITLHLAGDVPSIACDVDGFFSMFTILSAMYGAVLQIYFLLRVRFSVRDRTFSRYYEPVLVVFPFLFAIISSSFMLSQELYNPNGHVTGNPGCFINEYPAKCGETSTCERGEKADLFASIFVAIPIVVSWAIVIVSNVFIYLRFRDLSKKLRRYSLTGDTTTYELTWKVAKQALMYVGAYFGTFGVTACLWSLQVSYPKIDFADSKYYGLHLTDLLLLANQGTLNFLVYLSPRYNRWRQAAFSESRWFAFKKAVFTEDSPQAGNPPADNVEDNTPASSFSEEQAQNRQRCSMDLGPLTERTTEKQG